MPKQIEYRFLFVRDGQISLGLSGTIPEHWGTLSDMINECDALAIQRKDGKGIDKILARHALSLLIEDTADDVGYPLVWRVVKGTLFVSADMESEYLGSLAYLQSKAFLSEAQFRKVHQDEEYTRTMDEETKGIRYEEPASWKSFDFHGAISLLEKKQVRRPIEEMMAELRAQPKNELPPWAALYREQFLSLEEVMKTNPAFRNSDLWDYANLLYDEYKGAIEENDSEGPENFQDLRDEILDSLHSMGLKSVNDIAVALSKTPDIKYGYFAWQKRVAIELATHPRIEQSPVIETMVIQLLEEIELNYPGCVWCGKEETDPGHSCEERERFLRPSAEEPSGRKAQK